MELIHSRSIVPFRKGLTKSSWIMSQPDFEAIANSQQMEVPKRTQMTTTAYFRCTILNTVYRLRTFNIPRLTVLVQY